MVMCLGYSPPPAAIRARGYRFAPLRGGRNGDIGPMSGSLAVAYCRNDVTSGYERPSVSALRQAREGDEFYIPDFIRTGVGQSRPDVYAAASDHAHHLRTAEAKLADVLNLVRVLRAS